MTRAKTLARRASSRCSPCLTAFLVGAVVIILTDFVSLALLPARTRWARSAVPSAVSATATARCSSAPSATRPRSSRPSRSEHQRHRDRHPAAHRDARRRDAADPRRPGRSDLVPRRHVQHRRRWPARSSEPCGATITAIVLQGQVPAAVILLISIAAGVLSGAVLGLHPGIPEGADGCARGHHDHHAQLRRRAGRPLRPALADVAGPRQHGADLEVRCPTSCDIPLILDLPAIRLALRVRGRAAHGRGGVAGSCSRRPRATSCRACGLQPRRPLGTPA